jgi:hypothetical protein
MGLLIIYMYLLVIGLLSVQAVLLALVYIEAKRGVLKIRGDIEKFKKDFKKIIAPATAVALVLAIVGLVLSTSLYSTTPAVSIGIEPNGTANGLYTYVVSIQVLESPYWQTHMSWFIFSVKAYANGTPVPCLIRPKPPIGIMPNWWNADTAFPVPMITLYCPEKITQAIVLTSNGNITITP